MTRAAHILKAQDLIDFETEVKQAFLDQKIRAPIHLSGGNEEKLIAIFEEVREEDWVLSTWRNHYHALLKGIPSQWLMDEILAGHSMYIENRQYKFLSSSIVGGILPIAVGLAMGAQRARTGEHVWCFVGDMAIKTGIAFEAMRYSTGHGLPVTFVEEDNGLSTNTPTTLVWGSKVPQHVYHKYYQYVRQYPHVGIGQWVTFG